MTIMTIATVNQVKSKVHRRITQPKFKIDIVDEHSSSPSSADLRNTTQPTDHHEVEKSSDLQQRELIKSLRVANLNATLLTAKLEAESKKSYEENNQYDPDLTKILDNIVGALDVFRNTSDLVQKNNPAA